MPLNNPWTPGNNPDYNFHNMMRREDLENLMSDARKQHMSRNMKRPAPTDSNNKTASLLTPISDSSTTPSTDIGEQNKIDPNDVLHDDAPNALGFKTISPTEDSSFEMENGHESVIQQSPTEDGTANKDDGDWGSLFGDDLGMLPAGAFDDYGSQGQDFNVNYEDLNSFFDTAPPVVQQEKTIQSNDAVLEAAPILEPEMVNSRHESDNLMKKTSEMLHPTNPHPPTLKNANTGYVPANPGAQHNSCATVVWPPTVISDGDEVVNEEARHSSQHGQGASVPRSVPQVASRTPGNMDRNGSQIVHGPSRPYTVLNAENASPASEVHTPATISQGQMGPAPSSSLSTLKAKLSQQNNRQNHPPQRASTSNAIASNTLSNVETTNKRQKVRNDIKLGSSGDMGANHFYGQQPSGSLNLLSDLQAQATPCPAGPPLPPTNLQTGRTNSCQVIQSTGKRNVAQMTGGSVPAVPHITQQEFQRRKVAQAQRARENARQISQQQQALAHANMIWDGAVLTITRMFQENGMDPGVLNFVSPFDALGSMTQPAQNDAPRRPETPQFSEQQQRTPQVVPQSQHVPSEQDARIRAQQQQSPQVASQTHQFQAQQALRMRQNQQRQAPQHSLQSQHLSAQPNTQNMARQQQFQPGTPQSQNLRAHQTPRLQQGHSGSETSQRRPAQMMATHEADIFTNLPQATGDMFQNFAGPSRRGQFQNQKPSSISAPSGEQADNMFQNPGNLQYSLPNQTPRRNSATNNQGNSNPQSPPEVTPSPQPASNITQDIQNIQHANNNANRMIQVPSNQNSQLVAWFESVPPEFWLAGLQNYLGTPLPQLGNLMSGSQFRYISNPGVNLGFIVSLLRQTFPEISHLLRTQLLGPNQG